MRIQSLDELEKFRERTIFFLRNNTVVSAIFDRSEPPVDPSGEAPDSDWKVFFRDVQGAKIFLNFYYSISFFGPLVLPCSERAEAEAIAARCLPRQRRRRSLRAKGGERRSYLAGMT